MKTIALFNTSKVWGGGEKWFLDMAVILQKNRYNVILCVLPNSKLQEKAIENDITNIDFLITNKSFVNPIIKRKIEKFLIEKKVDVVILNSPKELKTVGIVAHKIGVNKIIYRRGSSIPIKNTFSNRYIFKHFISDIIANSEGTKRTILQNNSNLFPIDKIHLIYNGIDLTKIKIQEKKQNKKMIIGAMGRLEKEKNFFALIEIAKILQKQNIDFCINIAGIGSLEEELKNQAIEIGVADKINFIGFIDNISDFFSNIDVFVSTSLWEGFAYVVLEALAHSKPVVSFDSEGPAEIIKNDYCGYIIKDRSNEAFANKIISFYEDNSKLAEFSNNAIIISKKFDINNTFYTLEKLINS